MLRLTSRHAPHGASSVTLLRRLCWAPHQVLSRTCISSAQSHSTAGPLYVVNRAPATAFPQSQRAYATASPTSALARLMNRPLQKAETEANASPQNAEAQASYYQELLKADLDPHIVIDRFEQFKAYASNEQCLRYYVLALSRAGQADKILGKVAHYLQQLDATSPDMQAWAEKVTAATTTGGTPGAVENPFFVVMKDKEFSLKRTAWSFVKTAAWAFFILTVVSMFLESQGIGKMGGASQNEVEPNGKQTVKFEDVAGVDEAKQELEEIVEFLKDPEKFTALGGKMPKGVLLTGPPGTGKTLLARAVAGEAGVPFFFMSGSEFDELYVGVGARRVRELFSSARKKAPSIVFIDELDAIGGTRNPKDQSFMRQTLNQLLVDLDGFSQTEGVIFMAATNFPEMLDKALIRPGRFDKHVTVPLPDVRGRMQVLNVHSKKINLSPEVNMSVLARGTPGFSGAELANLVNQAAVQASREGYKEVQMRHLEFAKDRILMGAERKSAVITESSKRITAYHEGGHALVAYYTPGAIPLHKATIMPRGQSLGMTVQLPEMDKDNYSKKEYLAMLDVCMGGRAAEELILGEENVTSGAHNDIEKATAIARKLITHLGMSEKIGMMALPDEDYHLLSPATKLLVEQETKALVESAYQRAKTMLKARKEELNRLAKALIDYETLSQEEIDMAIRGVRKSPPLTK
ncbi:i-AAA protease yme1 [Sorochytrium milnesiophthora]